MLLNIMGYRGISWNRVEDHVIKACLGRSLRILEYHGIPWNIVESRGISCNHGRTLRLLEYLGAGSILPRGVSQHHPQTEEVATQSGFGPACCAERTRIVRGLWAAWIWIYLWLGQQPLCPHNVPRQCPYVYSRCTPTSTIPRNVCISIRCPYVQQLHAHPHHPQECMYFHTTSLCTAAARPRPPSPGIYVFQWNSMN